MSLFIAVGVCFGSIAGLMAFLITYLEYRRHKLKGWLLWRPCLFVGLSTFIMFVLLAGSFGLLLLQILKSPIAA